MDDLADVYHRQVTIESSSPRTGLPSFRETVANTLAVSTLSSLIILGINYSIATVTFGTPSGEILALFALTTVLSGASVAHLVLSQSPIIFGPPALSRHPRLNKLVSAYQGVVTVVFLSVFLAPLVCLVAVFVGYVTTSGTIHLLASISAILIFTVTNLNTVLFHVLTVRYSDDAFPGHGIPPSELNFYTNN